MNYYIFKCILIFYAVGNSFFEKNVRAEEEENTCPYVTLRKSQTEVNTSFIDFKYRPEHELKGVSVELFFNHDVNDLQVISINESIYTVHDFSKTHWAVSIMNTTHIGNQIAFKGSYNDLLDAKVTGVIWNGVDRLCGEGKSKVFVPGSLKYEGHRVCSTTVQSWEHDSRYKIEENFQSDILGLVMDVIFDREVDNISDVSTAVYKRMSLRRFTFINHGFVADKDDPLVLEFGLNHFNKPPPKIAAICINNVIVCGFAPAIKVVGYDPPTSISSISANPEHSLMSLEYSLWALIGISMSGVVATIVLSVLAWKIASREHGAFDMEPIYSMPSRDFNTQ